MDQEQIVALLESLTKVCEDMNTLIAGLNLRVGMLEQAAREN